MIRGMSYPQGIFYMDKDHIAHATINRNGEIVTRLFPFDSSGVWFFAKQIILTIPWYFILGMLLLAGWIFSQPGWPLYWLALAGFGYHFVFPYPLKQYHGAEHKIFSYQGKKSIRSLEQIRQASIVNRNCSTNSVIIFYLLFLLGFLPLGGNPAALLGLMGVYIIPRWIKPLDRRLFLLSAFFQRKVTTVEPDEKHLKVALLSYLTLQRKQALHEAMLWEEIRAEEEKERKRQAEQEREFVIRETEWMEI